MTATTGKTALIIGASRGLGYALAADYLTRGWQVTATVRGARRTELRDRLAQTTFDLLFINAGVTNGPEETVADVSTTPSSGSW